MEIGADNIFLLPGELNIYSIANLVKEYCNRVTKKPEFVLVPESIFSEINSVFNMGLMTVVTNRSNPIVTVQIKKAQLINQYIVII